MSFTDPNSCDKWLSIEDIVKSALIKDGENTYIRTHGELAEPDPYCPKYRAVYNAYINKPSDADALIQNTMVVAFVAAGLWDTKLDRRFITANHTNAAGEAQLDWINPSVNPPLLNVNGCVYTAQEGFAGDGLSKYLNTQYNPAVNAVLYTLNSAAVSAYSRTAGSLTDVIFGAVSGVTNVTQILPKYSGTTYCSVNENLQTFNNTPTGSGEYIISRLVAASQQIYWNKNLYSSNRVSVGIPNGNFYILARNNGVPDSFSIRQASKSIIGAGYSQAEANNETDIFETYLDTYGKGMIP